MIIVGTEPSPITPITKLILAPNINEQTISKVNPKIWAPCLAFLSNFCKAITFLTGFGTYSLAIFKGMVCGFSK